MRFFTTRNQAGVAAVDRQIIGKVRFIILKQCVVTNPYMVNYGTIEEVSLAARQQNPCLAPRLRSFGIIIFIGGKIFFCL